MLWKVGNYNALRHDQETLKKQYQQLQSTVIDTNQRLEKKAVQSLATEVAMTYGVLRYHPAAFDQRRQSVDAQDAFDRSIEQYTFLKRNAAVIAVSSSGLHLLSPMSFADSTYTPSIWLSGPHHATALASAWIRSAVRVAFHTEWMWRPITERRFTPPPTALSTFLATTPATAAGGRRSWVGITTWYAHLSAFTAVPERESSAGEVVGYTGISGRSTGPHVHYEVRMNNAPINPWRYMKSTPAGD